MKYVKASAKVVHFSNEDVIQTSGCTNINNTIEECKSFGGLICGLFGGNYSLNELGESSEGGW